MNNKQIKRMEEYLDERFDIYVSFGNEADGVFYRACCDTLLMMGIDFRRDENGKHTIFA